jgi:hypothetical protein
MLVHQQTTTLIAPNKNESMFKFVCGDVGAGGRAGGGGM